MAPPRSHRLGAALKHVFQGAFFTLIIAPFIALPGVCAFAVFLAPPFFLGVLSNSRSSEMGLPEGWVRLNARFPLAIVLGIFVHLPIGFACLISVCGMLLLNAPALFTFELLGVLGMRFLWAAPPSTPDVENPKRRLAAGHAQSGGGAPDVRRIDVVEVPPSSDGGPTTSGRSDHNLGENSESSENGAAADVVELRARLEVMGLSTKGKRRELTDRYAEHTDPARYREFGAVWEALKGDSVRLVSLKWLMALAARGGVLQRRQDLPEAAFLSRQRLVAIEAKAAHGLDAEGLNEAVTKFVGGGRLRGRLTQCLLAHAHSLPLHVSALCFFSRWQHVPPHCAMWRYRWGAARTLWAAARRRAPTPQRRQAAAYRGRLVLLARRKAPGRGWTPAAAAVRRPPQALRRRRVARGV